MSPTSAVNKTVDVKVKEKDIKSKLRLYGIYSAFGNGKVPSNKQIDVALNTVLASDALSRPSKKLSSEGQRLVGDVRDVIEQAKLLLLTKNQGNLIQDFIWQTQQISAGEASVPNVPVDKETAQQHGTEALDGLRTLGTLIISNGQFRKLLSDAQILFRDMIGDAATNVASKINPTDEQLSQIDHPAEDNTWHDVPDINKDKLKTQLKSQWNAQKPFSRSDVDKAAGEAIDAATQGDRNPESADPRAGAAAGADTLKERAEQNVPDETKDQVKENADRIKEKRKEYWGKKMPQERRDQTVYRLKKMVVEIQGHQDYLRAIETLLRLAEEYAGHSRTVARQGQGAVKGAHSDDSLQIAEANLRTLIERFANGTSLDDLFDAVNQIYRDADNDPELRGWFKEFDTYIRKCLKEQGYILQDESADRWNELYDRGHYLFREKYRSHTDHILDEFKFIGNQFDEDPQNRAFANALQALFAHLGSDENGTPAFKPHLLKDLSEVILPGLFTNIRYVPVPRIEYSDSSIDAIIENLVIESDNLAPNVLEFGTDNYWRWGRKKIANKNKNKVMLSVSGVQMDLRDVSYYIKRKQGSPKLTDTGVADIFLGGDGLSFKVEMETADKGSKEHLFKINKVSVDIKNLSIKLKKSNHKLLFSLCKPLLLKLIRPALEKVVEQQVRNYIIQFDELAFTIQQEANKAKLDFQRNPSPEKAQNLYQRYLSAFNKRVVQTQKKTEEKVADKKLNMAITQHDSIFKDISLPGGISTQATEFKELAAQGDNWESPVFSIGSAGETRELPTFPKVTRKTHGPMSTTRTGPQSHAESSSATTAPNSGLNGDVKALSDQMDKSFSGHANGNAAPVRS